MLTREMIEQALPTSMRGAATDEFTDMVNNATTDPIVADHIRENFITYARVLQEGKFKTEDYLRAVTYVSFKHMGLTNQDAYARTFPQRMQQLISKGVSQKDISAYVAAYHKGKLVNLILEQSLIPAWLINQDNFQRAINTQVAIMEDTSLPAVARTAAANSLLTHLAKPKEAVNTLKIEMTESSGMRELMGLVTELATKQREAIEAGVPTKEIAEQKLIDITPMTTEEDPVGSD